MQNSPAYDSGYAVGQMLGYACCPITCLLVFVGLLGGGIFWFMRKPNNP